MKSRTLYINDKTTTEDAKIEFTTLKYELHKIINESTDVLENFLFCTGLISTSKPKFVVNSSVHPYLHPNYHHRIKLTRNMALRANEH